MTGKLKIPCTFDYAGSFEGGYAKIRTKKLTGMIMTSGKLIIPAYVMMTFPDPLLFISKREGKFG